MDLLVLQFFQYSEDIDDAVSREIVFYQKPSCLSARAAPADTDPAGTGERCELAFVMLHVGQKERVNILDRDDIINAALLDAERRLGIGNLGGAGGDKDDPDILRPQPGLFHSSRKSDLRRHFHRRLDREQPGEQGGKFHTDQADHGRTGRTYERRLVPVRLYVFPGCLGNKLRRGTYFIDVVESQFQQCIQDNVNAAEIIVLGVE